jgi:hypothetical protein
MPRHLSTWYAKLHHGVPLSPEHSPPTLDDDDYINTLEDDDVKESSVCRALVSSFILASTLRPAAGRPRQLLRVSARGFDH